MTAEQRRVLHLFGDQTFGVQPQLGNLIGLAADNPALKQFLHSAHRTIQTEARSVQETWLRDSYASLFTLDQLLGWDPLSQRTGTGSIALEMSLTCLIQIAAFILDQPEGEYVLVSNQRCVLGLCTGALTAAAIGCSDTKRKIVQLGTESVRAAFRAGIVVSRITRVVMGPTVDEEQKCAMAILGSGVEEVVSSFCQKREDLSAAEKPCVAVRHPLGITVMAPPATLAEIRAAGLLDAFELRDLPIYGLYHAAHLYSKTDVQSIFSDLSPELASLPSYMSVASGAGGIRGGVFQELLEAALEQIMRQPLHWGALFETLTQWSQEHMSGDSTTQLPVIVIEYGSRAGAVISKHLGPRCSVVDKDCSARSCQATGYGS
ncbi:hypothetical protein TI39_contig4335g00009 [Zymoseptoria brevis]|uniref:Starter acyltransferase (SAT) domain-containing protein n=1 Tax=Zymoseptoria brevis TaxID=1047168 RepID=A0A0F4G7I3_9PEZI|nr:hypothetical protein TI39_contig4335g00009 [Zymoseptoria brevis]